jgi:nitrate reductase NapAB chaperone NapD
MNVGRHEKKGHALMVIALDDTLTPEQIDRVREIPDVINVRLARI